MRRRLACSLGFGLSLLAGCGAGPFVPLGDADGGETSSGETSSTGDSTTGDPSGADSDSTSDTDDDPDPTTAGVFMQFGDNSPGSCGPFTQDCPDGEKCVAYANVSDYWNATKCVPVTGSQPAGQPCVYAGPEVATDDCDADSSCWNALPVGEESIGTCSSFCGGTSDAPTCADPLTSCRMGNEGSVALCLPTCDPLLQACEPGLGCYWSEGSGDFHCIRSSGPGIPSGVPCGFNNDCAPGNFCADMDAVSGCMGSACCASYCVLGQDPSPCGPTSSCIPFFADGTAPPELVDLGLCVASEAPAPVMSDAW